MTSKRYRKLAGALMAQIMKGEPKAGKCIYSARHATPLKGSYEENWNNLVKHFATLPYVYPVIKQHS